MIPLIPTLKDTGKDAVSVSETFSSEKHVSMKVQHSSSGFESFSTTSGSTLPEFKRIEMPKIPEVQSTVSQEEKVEMKETKASALNYFKSMVADKKPEITDTNVPKVWTPSVDITIKDSKKTDYSEKYDRPLSPVFHLEPGPPPEIGFIPKSGTPTQKDDMMERVKKLQDSYKDLPESEIPTGAVKMYPMPIKKVVPPVEYVDHVVFPERKKSIEMDYSHKKQVVEEVLIPQKVELPGINEIPMSTPTTEPHLTSPISKPATNVSVISQPPKVDDKLWTSVQKEQTHKKFESFSKEEKSFSSSQSYNTRQSWSPSPQVAARPSLPHSFSPSLEALSMEKKWGHKHSESKLKTVWPPPIDFFHLPAEEVADTSSKTEVRSSSAIESSSTVKTSQISSQSQPAAIIPQFQPKVEPLAPTLPEPTIYYVAEARATHRSTTPAMELSRSSQMYSSSTSSSEHVLKESTITQDKNILLSEAKKIWGKGPPVSYETRGFSKIESKFSGKRSNSLHDLKSDEIHIEPGPPPVIGYASPTPKERRQSYVEAIEQDLEKDLEKEPSRHLAGAVRIMPPPPKKDQSVEREIISLSMQSKKYQRTNSLDEFKKFPDLEPFPFSVEPTRPHQDKKFGTVPQPSKFVKKPYSGSDYESDFEARIKARWTPWDSDAEEPHFRSVKPPEAGPRRPHSTEPQPIPPTKFDKGPITVRSFSSSLTDDRFQQSKSETISKPIKFDVPKQLPQQQTSPPKKVESPKIKKEYESGYMADTDEPGKFTNATKMSLQQSSQWRSETSKFEKKTFSSKVEKVGFFSLCHNIFY